MIIALTLTEEQVKKTIEEIEWLENRANSDFELVSPVLGEIKKQMIDWLKKLDSMPT